MRMRQTAMNFELCDLFPGHCQRADLFSMDLKGRAVGSLVGLAVCDAVGTTVEFMPPGSFDPVLDMVGGGKFNLLPGQVCVY